ncbi:MAG TPA: hypothetical protein DCE42_02450 [Myxococcales bacterium]|nr:hypothetical protein [Deltaproteobacteria bacterium]HAA53585.1 hypothetical protein [Myxococcales bacterium]
MNTRRMFRATFTVCLLLWTVGIYSSGCADTPKNENEIVVTIKDGENAYELIQEALIKATAGKTVVLPEGTFSLSRSLSLTVDNVTVRGQGMDKTVLSFKTQKVENKEEGAQGLRVQASGVVLEGFAIEDTQGDAIKVEDADGITFRKIRVEWTGGPDEKNGSYGLYPVKCKHVLIEDCVAKNASDAGIYVGQSEQIIVRRNHAEGNVAGIEIENSKYADVYENTATKNTGGILVFDLPKLPVQGGKHCRVYNNNVTGNNTDNFAPEGAIVGKVPAGVGIMILSNDNVEIFKNTLKDNKTAHILIVNYEFAVGKFDDPKFDPYPEGIFIHDNTFENGGYDPDGEDFKLLVALVGKPLPDVIYDGIFDEKKQKDGKTPKELMICFKGEGTWVNLHAYETIPKPDKDKTPHACELPALDPISFDKEG